MWARKLQELTDMGVIPDYRSAAAHAAREGGYSLTLTLSPTHDPDPDPARTLTHVPKGPLVQHRYGCTQ